MSFAVIIPTLNEERLLRQRLDEVEPQSDLVVVSDGGSVDLTTTIAKERGAITVVGARGRGPQLNRGARRAIEEGADVLLFLHADTMLPSDARAKIEACIEQGAIGGGCQICLDNARGLLRHAPGLVNRRTRRRKIPLGDQAQFATASSFQDIDGFADWPILEDLDFIRRLAKTGKLAVPEVYVVPSPRRFEQQGVLKTVVLNWIIWRLHELGVKPQTLNRLYSHRR